MTDPGPTDPGPTDPGPTDPGPTDPGPTDPGQDAEHPPARKYLAATERAALCTLAQEVGPDAPTLCEGWAVRDLMAHLALRESHIVSTGILVPGLAGLADRAVRRTAAGDFDELIERVRKGAPFYSPFRLTAVDKMVNAMEYFIHHEDVRRAQPGWSPRLLSARTQDALWKAVRKGGRGLLRKAPVGVVATRSDTGATATLKGGDPAVTVQGLPAEITLFAYGRTAQADVELLGAADAIARLTGTSLGL